MGEVARASRVENELVWDKGMIYERKRKEINAFAGDEAKTQKEERNYFASSYLSGAHRFEMEIEQRNSTKYYASTGLASKSTTKNKNGRQQLKS